MFNKIANKTTINYKTGFYVKSLVLRTDFSLYKREFKLWHPRYFDIARRTEYEKTKRDFKKLKFNTQDPLFFDYNLQKITGTFKMVLYN